MYNGIGLTTPRGSGTNGHVQSNKSNIRFKNQKREIKLLTEKSPNIDLLIHEEKKKVEIELFKLKSDLIKQGKLTPEEIDQQISDKRKERMTFIETECRTKEEILQKENFERNERFKRALSLDKKFGKEGIKSTKDEMVKRKEKPSSSEKKQRKKKRKHHKDSSSSDSSSESASSSDSDN